MGSRRAQSVLVVAALAVATMVGAMATPIGTEPTPQAVSTDSATARATPGATPALAYGDLYDAIIPGQRDAVAAATAGTLPRYRIRATLEPPAGDGTLATASGTVEVRYVNTTGEAVDQLPFRLYPNLRQYDAGRMEIERTAVDGVAVSPRSPALHAVPAATPVATPAVDDADLILVWVPLPRPLQPGAATTVSMAFVTTVPADPPAASGRFRYHPDRGAWALSGWYPMLAGYDPAAGWDIDPPAAWSDVTFGGEGLYDVAIAAPESMVLVTPGVEVSAGGDGDARRFVSGPAREFAVYADPSMAETRAEVDGTTVTVHHPADSASGAEQILAWATGALETYSGLFGAYPYAALDVAAVPGVTGLEFSGMFWLDEGYVADPVGTGSRPGAIEFLVAHEVAHQWWYGVVGSNPQRAPFLDEGLADYSAVLYFEQAHGDDAARAQVDQGLLLPYATMLVTGGDQVVDQPAAAFPNEAAYYATAYRKAALGLEAIRQQIGDDAFHAALRNYAEAHRFGFAAPADLLDAFERSADADPGDLWHLWFETASGRVRIVMEPEGGTPVETPPG